MQRMHKSIHANLNGIYKPPNTANQANYLKIVINYMHCYSQVSMHSTPKLTLRLFFCLPFILLQELGENEEECKFFICGLCIHLNYIHAFFKILKLLSQELPNGRKVNLDPMHTIMAISWPPLWISHLFSTWLLWRPHAWAVLVHLCTCNFT